MPVAVAISNLPAVFGRLGVLVPTVPDRRVSVHWAMCLERLALPLPADPPRVRLDYRVDFNREALAAAALEAGADWLLWWDDDVLPPEDGLLRLLSHRYPITSGCYVDRMDRPAAAYLACWEGRFASAYPPPLPPGRHIYVDAVGLGFCLMDARVLRALPRPWFAYTPDLGEDFGLCWRIREHLGIPVLLDGDVPLGHERTVSVWPDRSHHSPAVREVVVR